MTKEEAKIILANITLPMTTVQAEQFRTALQVRTFGGGFVRTYNHDANVATPEIPIPDTYDNDANPATPEIPVPPAPSFWDRLKFW